MKMENELKLCGVKTDNLRKQLDKVQSQSSDILLFDLQWRDLEDYLKSAEEKLEKRFDELALKEKELKDQSFALEERAKVIEAAEAELADLERKSEEKRKELGFLRDESNAEELRLTQVRKTLEVCSAEQRSKEIQLNEVVESLKKTQVDLERLRVEVSAEVDHLDEEIERKTKDLTLLQEKTAECGKMLETRSLELVKTQGELELNGKQLGQLKIDLERHHGELSAEMKNLDSSRIRNRELEEEIERKRKDLTDLTAELISKECDLNTVKKKIQDFQSEEEKQVRLKASLMEREQRLELKEKEIDAKEKRINKKDQQLKSTEKRSANSVKDSEMKAKKLSSSVHQSNTDHHDLVREANVTDNKTLQLVLRGHMNKCPQLHLDVSRSLKASPDPAKLVLDTIQGLYSAHQRTKVVTNLDRNSVRRSSIYLLECLMDMSLKKPMTRVQEEAFNFATEWKNTTLVKAENPMEVFGFLHFLAEFSLAFSFDANKVKNLFDVAFLRKYTPSLCEALGISALAPVNNVLSLDDKPEQVQENIASSSMGNEDALRDIEGSASFAPNEVSTKLPTLDDPGRFVLSSVEEALTGAQQRNELGLAEPIVKNLIPLLEELQRVSRSYTDAVLQLNATKVGHRWSCMMRNNAQKSQLEAWAFLQFIVAFGLVKQTKPEETFPFASYVSHFKEAPKLFKSLGLSYAIPNFVKLLINKGLYIPAIRFMFFFNVMIDNFSPRECLIKEIMDLRRPANEKRRFESQAEDGDAARMRDVIELIEEFELRFDLPVDLIVKFMVPRKQCVVVSSSSVPVQPPQILSRFQMQASQMTVHSSYIPAYHGSNPSFPTSFDAGGSTVGFKRAREDTRGSRPAIRPCFNPPSGYGRF